MTAPQTCDRERIEAFLRGDLRERDECEFTAHLNDCAACRCLLEHRAAEASSWEEAGRFLASGEVEWNDAAVGDSGSDDGPQEDPLPLQIRNVLGALAPTDDPTKLGRLGGYEISGVVGSGGMGVVLKAFDQSLDRTVAIKVLSPHLASSGAARKRFAREGKAAAAVLHPNVVAIHGVSSDNGLPYLVMAYNRGCSLQKRLDDQGMLPVVEVLRIGSQIVEGLTAAHAQGLVHRDIKPANILLEEGVERVAITDFGLARAVDDATMTRSGVIAGTPQYMSPEQARGESIDSRSDLFSLGSVMYAMCTGRPPFRAETSFGILRRITDEEPRPIRELNSDIPMWLCRLISKLHAKSPQDRYETADEVARDVTQCLSYVQTPGSRLPDQLQPRPLTSKVVGVGSAVVVGLAVAIYGWLGTGPGPGEVENALHVDAVEWDDSIDESLLEIQQQVDAIEVEALNAFRPID